MIEITSWPCLIMAAPRTGSNVLAASISVGLERHPWHLPVQQGFGHRCFYEPDEDPSTWAAYQRAVADADQMFVVKIMSNQAHLYQDSLQGNGFKIRLYREDTVGQIASFYIANQRNQWYKRPGDSCEDYSVEIRQHMLEQALVSIIDSNDQLFKHRAPFDITLSYESLGHIENPYNAPTHNPDNLLELRSVINQLLDRRGIPKCLSATVF